MASKAAMVVMVLGGAAAVGLVAAMFAPKKASAAPLGEGAAAPTSGAQPTNAEEAYGLAMNPNMKDPAYVHQLASWLASSGQRPDWGAAAEKRSIDLQAEQVLASGLQTSATPQMIQQDIAILAPTHPTYSAVLVQRQQVEAGGAVPAPYTLTLLSGGELAIDLSIYRKTAPLASGGAQPSVSPAIPASVATAITEAAPQAVQAAQSAVTTLPAIAIPALPATASSPATPAQVVPAMTIPVVPAVPAVPTPVATAVTAVAPAIAAVAASVPAAAAPAVTTPVAAAELTPQADPNGTLALCRVLLAEQEKSGWKYVSTPVKEWQRKVGLTADGKLGAGSVLRMAQECAVLPWVRYWSLGVGDGSKAAAVKDFQSRLRAYAQTLVPTKPDVAAKLMLAADAETGQGWPAKPAAAPMKEPSDEAVAEKSKELQKGKK